MQGKQGSLQSAAETAEATIIAITETAGKPPELAGYKWVATKERTNQGGGGVAIAVREDLTNRTTPCTTIDKGNEEAAWIEIKTSQNRYISIGTYYGKQEIADEDTVIEEYESLTTQITQLKTKGEVILTGDFNAKLQTKLNDTTVQEQFRNGQHLKNLMDTTKLKNAASHKNTVGLWTRQKRTNPDERSIIDHILTTEKIANNIRDMNIDEKGTLRLKGRKESDHNTITLEFDTRIPKTETKTRKWKLDNKQGWAQYNQIMNARAEELKNMDYQTYINETRKILKQTIGEKTITTGRYKKRESEATKEARESVKLLKKQYNQAILTKDSDTILTNLDTLRKAQTNLRNEIEQSEKTATEEELNKMKSEGGTKSNTFWKHRARISGKFTKEEYDTMDEQGKIIEDPEKAKEHIATFFEDLYQARPARPEAQQRTEEIQHNIEKIKEEMKNLPKPKEITKKEMKKSIKKLQRGKATGPDKIPNEAIIEANETTNEILRHQLNKILTNQQIPDEWQHGEIIRLYKGKGKKGMCSNERGITLASNIGKLFERIINERLKTIVEITDAQAGGRAGSATTDHLLILQQAIQSAKNRKKDVYMGFLDVTKAYDKAWILGIMHILYERGLEDSLWETVLNLNDNLTATLKTKYGHTRAIKIRDSLRQGGVLAVLQYGIMMDQINQAIKAKGLGIKLQGTDTKIPSLLWVDDVLVMAESIEELQEMLNVINEIAAEYHIEFGMAKSQVLKIGKEEAITMMPLGNQAMTQTNTYKYLGFHQNNKNKLTQHIKATKSKCEGAYQKILNVAGDKLFKGIQLKVIWELIEVEITAIALNTSEIWEPDKQENKQHNAILDNIIKRVLKVPRTTPREVLYMELGILDLESMRIKNRINMEHRVNKKGSETTKTAMNAPIKKGWKEHTDTLNSKIGTTSNSKNHIKEKIHEYHKTKINQSGTTKSKVQYLMTGTRGNWKVNQRPQYLNMLTRNQASALFKARTRMFPVKNNFRGAHSDDTCRFCNNAIETQEHILNECTTVHNDNTTKVTSEDIFATNSTIQSTKLIAKKLETILEQIEKLDPKPITKTNKYPCTHCTKQCRINQQSIECTECQKWTHLKCTNLTQIQFQNHTNNPNEAWKCSTCDPSPQRNITITTANQNK